MGRCSCGISMFSCATYTRTTEHLHKNTVLNENVAVLNARIQKIEDLVSHPPAFLPSQTLSLLASSPEQSYIALTENNKTDEVRINNIGRAF